MIFVRRHIFLRFFALLFCSTLIFMAIKGDPAVNRSDTGRKDSTGNYKEYYEEVKMYSPGFPLTRVPVTLKMSGMRSTVHSDWNDMLVFKEYEKITNVKVEFDAIPEEYYRDRLSIMVASDELPDAFLKGALEPVDVAEYGANGILIPLEGLIENYAPNFKKLMDAYPEVKSACYGADGHIYSLPAIVTLDAGRSDKHWINKLWLKKAGVKTPRTIYELKAVLKAFGDNDMNGNGIVDDEIPMTGENIQQIIDNFAGTFGLEIQMGYYININSEKVELWLKSEKYKDLLKYLSELYKEGLLDRDIFCSHYKIFLPKIRPDKVGFFNNQTDDIFSMYSDSFIGIPPIKGPMGYQIQNQRPVARDFGAFAISSLNKYPEITMKWIDYFYGEEGSLFFRMGVEGKTYLKLDNGTYDYVEEINKYPKGLAVAAGQISIWPGRGAPHWINDQNSVGINSKNTQDAQGVLKEYLVPRVYNRPILDKSSEKRLRELKTNIDMFVESSREMFIKGTFSFDQWDTYCKTLDRLGIKELEELYQKAFDTLQK